MKTTIIFTFFCLIFYSCTNVSEISTYYDLQENLNKNIQIVGTDTSIYYVNNFTFSDSTISINAVKVKNNVKCNFEGELMFQNISYIQTYETSTWSTLAYAGINVFLISNALGSFSTAIKLEPNLHFSYGEGSCPYIYSWNGSDFKLEGEAFGISLGKSLETETNIILSDIKPEEDKIKIKIANERPETHFINNIKVSAVEINENEKLFSDNHQNLQTAKNLKSISNAEDLNKRNISGLIKFADNIYWNSDLSSANPKNNFEDIIYLSLNNLQKTDSVSLIITAINSEISNICFGYLQKILGDEFVNFTKAIEIDPELTSTMKDILLKSALKVDIWDGSNWKYVDLIYPEANYVKFEKLIRIPNLPDIYNKMKIRLRCLSDVWKIDAIQFDDSRKTDLKLFSPEFISYKTNTQFKFEQISNKDSNYAKLLPGQNIELQFSEIRPAKGKKIMYNTIVGGYLYEWIIEDNSISSSNKFFNLNTPKIILAKQLLKNIEFILPTVYKDWEEHKIKLAQNR